MGTFPSNQLGGLTYVTLHELITLMILPIGTSGTNEIQYIKYTSEYIPKLQIHQHQDLYQDHIKIYAKITITNTIQDNHQWKGSASLYTRNLV